MYEVWDPVGAIELLAQTDPQRVAVVDGPRDHTFGQLWRDAAELAAQLSHAGVGCGDLVALQTSRGYRAIVAMLAALSLDAGYTVLDPDVPPVRRDQVLRACRPRAELRLDGDDWQLLPTSDAAAPEPGTGRLGYVVFTSGSTGTPKGVRVSRDSLAWLTGAISATYRLRPEDRVLHSTALTFDVAAEEVWPTLASGAAVVVLDAPLGETGYARLAEFLHRTEVTMVNLPASYVAGWARYLADHPTLSSALRLVVAGSEAFPSEAARAWLEGPAAGIELFNAYGVSEATVTSIAGRLTADDVTGEGSAPLGGPLPGVVLRVLSPSTGLPVAAEEVGELLIGGPGVADGYIGSPELTADRFSTDTEGDRWYRTGDLVRQQGRSLVFLGRRDDQLKIGGHRIEPAEVVAAVLAVSEAQDARVFRVEERLVACLLGSAGLPEGDLRAALANRLPAYMVPVSFLELDRFPMTAGGKVDPPALRSRAEQIAARPAKPATEEQPEAPSLDALVALCRELLGHPEIHGHSNFFESGGTSLSAARLVATVFRNHRIVVPLDAVFAHPELDDLTKHIAELAHGC